MSRIKDVGPDTEKEVTPGGGVHSKIPYRFDLIPPEALFRMAAIFYEGIERGYEEENWRKVKFKDQLNHTLTHLAAYLSGDVQDDHLGHALVRLAMAVAVESCIEEDSNSL